MIRKTSISYQSQGQGQGQGRDLENSKFNKLPKSLSTMKLINYMESQANNNFTNSSNKLPGHRNIREHPDYFPHCHFTKPGHLDRIPIFDQVFAKYTSKVMRISGVHKSRISINDDDFGSFEKLEISLYPYLILRKFVYVFPSMST